MFDQILNWLAQAAGSDIFAGGLALGAIGLCVGVAHTLWTGLRLFAARRLMASVTVDNRSPDFRHLMVFLDQSGALRRIQHLRGTASWQNGQQIFAPAPGQHWIRIEGRFCLMTRGEPGKHRIGQAGKLMEAVTLTVPLASPDLIRGWITKGAKIAEAEEWLGPDLHVLKGDWWQHVTTLRTRPLASVVCEDDRITHLAADMRRFFEAEAWYAERGVPWRRGYLLHGPPGTGKSSVIRALASDLERDIATIALGAAKLTDDDLRDGMASAPDGAIIALEDIDAAFQGREGTGTSELTFSGLLNAIDGVAAQEGRALVMTTNHPERLDPALIRPGRIDLRVELAELGPEAAMRLFLRFFPGQEALGLRFREALAGSRHTPAALQGWLLAHADNVEKAATATGLRPMQHDLAAE